MNVVSDLVSFSNEVHNILKSHVSSYDGKKKTRKAKPLDTF